MTRIRVCAETALSVGQAQRLDLPTPIAVFRTETGIYAIDDTCTHAEASLAQGYVEDDIVECPVHLAGFCLKTGQPTCPPATRPVATHPVTIEGGEIYVDLTQ
jgi:3-phenylpropionate/trans-cinnamate dioxygenase ferredoxin subunit